MIAVVLAYALSAAVFAVVAVSASFAGIRVPAALSARLISWGACLIILAAVLLAVFGAGWTWDESAFGFSDGGL